MDQQVLELTRKAVVRATIERLRTTYSDLLVVKGYDGIPDFFEFNLYSPSNKEERDNALESLYEKLKTVAGKSMTENIHQIILLNRLTDSLDYDTAKVVIENNLIEDGKISRNNLYAAMGEANRFDERKPKSKWLVILLNSFFPF